MNPLDSFPNRKLTLAEETILAKKIKHGETAARQNLVLNTMREAVKYARHITLGEIEDDQLISICYDVLNRHAPRFNPKFGRFFAFCKMGLRGDARRSWRERDVVKGAKVLDKTPDREVPPRNDFGHGPNSTEIWDDKDEVTPEHEIGQPDFEGIRVRERWALVEPIIKKVCSFRERIILLLAYKTGFNFQEIADLMGVSRSAIQGAHAKALRRIRTSLLEKKRLLTD